MHFSNFLIFNFFFGGGAFSMAAKLAPPNQNNPQIKKTIKIQQLDDTRRIFRPPHCFIESIDFPIALDDSFIFRVVFIRWIALLAAPFSLSFFFSTNRIGFTRFLFKSMTLLTLFFFYFDVIAIGESYAIGRF